MARLLEMNSTSSTFTTRSTVIARAGTWKRFRWYSCLTVMWSRAIPYRARDPSAVEEIIDRNRLPMSSTRMTPAAPLPTILASAGT